MVNETFSYGSALQGSQIRVLVIQPAAHEADAISCTLEITALDKPCQYDALSYSWSDREDGVVEFCRSILCNGYELLVTKGAHDAIRHFRLKDAVRGLWIDAICINQSNVGERTQQVAMMAKVYAGAESVLIWVGEDDDRCLGRHALTVFVGMASKHWWLTKYDHASYPANGDDLQTLLTWFWLLGRWTQTYGQQDLPGSSEESVRRPRPYTAHLHAMFGADLEDIILPMLEIVLVFLRRRWFGRRWILQETFHGPRCEMHCGNISIGLDTFENAISKLAMETDTLWRKEPHRDFQAVYNAVHVADLRRNNNTHSRFCTPADVLFRYDAFDCSDPRDKVFALLSFHDHQLISPDYSMTIPKVYREFARAAVNNGNLAKILLQAGLRQPRTSLHSTGLPSWAPDWRVPVNISMAWWQTDSEGRYGFGPTMFDGEYRFDDDGCLSRTAWISHPLHSLSPSWLLWHCECGSARRKHGDPAAACAYSRQGDLTSEAMRADVVLHGDIRVGDCAMAIHWIRGVMRQYMVVVRKVEDAPASYTIVGWCCFRLDDCNFQRDGQVLSFRLV